MPTKIEWCDETRNPVKGLCKYACPYCYARKIQKRFGFPELVSLELTVFKDLPAAPRDVFVGSMHDILGEWVPDHWIDGIIASCKARPQHRYFFLSKNPGRFASFKWPCNSWLGTTVEDQASAEKRLPALRTARHGNLFVSFEPLLGPVVPDLAGIKWAIIGGLTPRHVHARKWFEDIVAVADAARIPVFMKDNLHAYLMSGSVRRQKPCQKKEGSVA
jgi:protein gp37